jgi:hypothetical protein
MRRIACSNVLKTRVCYPSISHYAMSIIEMVGGCFNAFKLYGYRCAPKTTAF